MIKQTKNKTVYAIVVAYNGLKWIEACLESLSKSNIPLNILVVDNGSTDGTVDLIREKFPDVEVVEVCHNIGFGKANNIGLKKVLAQGVDYAFLLNQDAFVEKNTIHDLMKLHEQHLEYGILCPIQLNANGEKPDDLFAQCTIVQTKELISDLVVRQKFLKEIYEVSFANAACWLLPHSTLEKVGGFDPLFFHYGEDNDYVERVKAKGLKMGLCVNEKVFHDRELRTLDDENFKTINNIFISNLLQIKSRGNNDCDSKKIFKMQLLSLLGMIVGRDKKYHNNVYRALLKVRKAYQEAMSHKLNENKVFPHYLK